MNPLSKKPRNRAETQQRIVQAVGVVLSEQGFNKIGINAIAHAAGVDKVLIYRYFGGLPQLLAAYGASGDFWPSIDEIMGITPEAVRALPPAARYIRFVHGFVDALRKRPLTLEILASEVLDHNELTTLLEDTRERWGEDIARALDASDPHFQRVDATAISVLLIGGIQYLLIRSRSVRVFGGIDLRTDAGWDRLKASMSQIAQALFPAP